MLTLVRPGTPRPPDPPPRRARRVWLAVTLAGLAMLAASGTAQAVHQPGPTVATVTGTGTAHVTWVVDGELTTEVQRLPWRLVAPAGLKVSVTAQLDSHGEITCQVGDRPARHATGAYPVVACSG